MALKALMLRKKIDDAKKALSKLAEKDSEFEAREAELAKAIEEVTEETTAEERTSLDEMVAAFDADKENHESEKETLERMIGDLENELAEEEKMQDTEPPVEKEERKGEKPTMTTRYKIFDKMTMQERTALVERDDVKAYLAEVRSAIREKRAITNVGLTIPTVLIGLLRQNIMDYSKLYKHVNVRPVSGDARAIVMGNIPEAIWTDCCANLNELDLGFNDLELGCWKVGGFFAICNANLEDSDIDLAGEILTALGQAIGKALDRAILYGTGNRMPLGIVTRLAQQSQPAGYSSTARPWADLHSTNIKQIANSVTGSALFAQLMLNMGAAKGKYSRGEIVHVMNETTYSFLIAQGIGVDATGAIVSRVNGSMPVIGGIIEVLDIVDDYQIISGYFDLYTLAERAGEKFASSEHFRFLSDQTVFKGTARYDGVPAIAEGFVVNAINGQSAVTSQNFPADKANEVSYVVLPTTATVASGDTLQLTALVGPGAASVSWASATTGKATVSSSGLVTGVASGSSVISATANGITASCTVTVTT